MNKHIERMKETDARRRASERDTLLTFAANVRKNIKITSLDDHIEYFVKQLNSDPFIENDSMSYSSTEVELLLSRDGINTSDLAEGELLQIYTCHITYGELLEIIDELKYSELLFEHFTNEPDEYEHQYESIEGAIVVAWQWNRYVGYSRNFEGLYEGSFFGQTKKDLTTGNEDRTWKTCYSVLLTAAEIEGLDDIEKLEKIAEELFRKEWKWNAFAQIPNRAKIISDLKLDVELQEVEE